jgi:hypothetical protein
VNTMLPKLKKYTAESKLSYLNHGRIVLISYILGLIIGNLLAMPFLVGTRAIIFMIGGAVMALPLLLIVLLILSVLKGKVEANIRTWCLLAPVVVVISWLTLEFFTNYSNRMNVFEYLSLRNVWERAFLGFLCSSVSATIYFYLVKCALSKEKQPS